MNKKMKKWLIPVVLMAVLALVLTSLASAQSKTTVGYIEKQRLQQELPQYQELQELFESKQAEFNTFGAYIQTQLNNELAKLEREKNAEVKGKSEAEVKTIEAKYQEKAEKTIQSYQQKLDEENERLIGELRIKEEEIDRQIRKVLEERANKNGYSIVLEKSVVYYGGVDLTDQVITALKK
ncbi:MAG: OmpH family outer membrane protein [Firmicutes bacterium]|nr:OmpH family outer membrane protein [Bacillota bacterium]